MIRKTSKIISWKSNFEVSYQFYRFASYSRWRWKYWEGGKGQEADGQTCQTLTLNSCSPESISPLPPRFRVAHAHALTLLTNPPFSSFCAVALTSMIAISGEGRALGTRQILPLEKNCSPILAQLLAEVVIHPQYIRQLWGCKFDCEQPQLFTVQSCRQS